MRPILTILPAACLAAGCTAPSTGPSFPTRCGPEFNQMTGRNIGEFTLPPGLPYRIAPPGAALTEDYNAARVTIFVDDKGWIGKVECG